MFNSVRDFVTSRTSFRNENGDNLDNMSVHSVGNILASRAGFARKKNNDLSSVPNSRHNTNSNAGAANSNYFRHRSSSLSSAPSQHHSNTAGYNNNHLSLNHDNNAFAGDDNNNNNNGMPYPPLPPKPVTISPLKRCLDNLKMTVLPQSTRLHCIAQALYEFDHKNKAHHDMELQAGAANILYQKLAFAIVTSKTQTSVKVIPPMHRGGGGAQNNSHSNKQYSDSEHEIAMICSALEMVHRASDAAVERSFEEIGMEILPLILQVIERPFQILSKTSVMYAYDNDSSDPSNLVSKDSKVSIQKITKVLAAYSLIPSARYEMAHVQNFLAALVKLIDCRNINRMGNSIHDSGIGGTNGIRSSSSGTGLLMTEATRFHAIAVITNLAHADGNRMYMIGIPDLVENVSRVATNDPNEMARQCASLALMNLSDGDEEHIPDMTGHGFVLDAILHLMRDDRADTRRNAAVSLYNIACSDVNADLLAKHHDGVVLEALVEIVSGGTHRTAHLNSAVNINNNSTTSPLLFTDSTRSSAAETLFHMSCSKNDTTSIRMANHPGFLEGVASVLLVTNKQVNNNNNNVAVDDGTICGVDVKMYAAATLRRISEVIGSYQPSNKSPTSIVEPLLAALVKGSGWVQTDCIIQGMKAQAEVRDRRKIMVEHHGLLNALSRLAMTPEHVKVRAGALSVIEILSKEESTRSIMSRNEGILLALTKASYEDGGGDEEDDHHLNHKEYIDSGSAASVKVALKNLVAAM